MARFNITRFSPSQAISALSNFQQNTHYQRSTIIKGCYLARKNIDEYAYTGKAGSFLNGSLDFVTFLYKLAEIGATNIYYDNNSKQIYFTEDRKPNYRIIETPLWVDQPAAPAENKFDSSVPAFVPLLVERNSATATANRITESNVKIPAINQLFSSLPTSKATYHNTIRDRSVPDSYSSGCSRSKFSIPGTCGSTNTSRSTHKELGEGAQSEIHELTREFARTASNIANMMENFRNLLAMEDTDDDFILNDEDAEEMEALQQSWE